MTGPTVEAAPVDPYDAVMARVIPQLRNPPQQARSIRTLRTILVTADAMIKRDGPDRFHTEDLAAAAGVSIGTVYRYFDDRIDIVDALAPHRHDAIKALHAVRLYLERTRAALAGTSEIGTPTAGDVVDHALALLRGVAA